MPEQDSHLAALTDPGLAQQVERMLAADREPLPELVTAGEGAAGVLARDLATAVPERIGPYRIKGKLGEGGMGVVYDAEEDHPRRRVALKTVHPWILNERGLERFRFEAQAMAGVNHPGIPAVYAAGEVDGTVFLAMEKVEGRSLYEHVAATRADLTGRVELVARVAEVVAHAHDNGLVHRDLKPQNIRVGANGQPYVLDFGIAVQTDDEAAASGTPAYAAPEQLRGEAVDERADVYALGVVLYELLRGQLPHAVGGLDKQAVAAVKQVAPAPLAEVPGDVAWVLGRALEPDPAARCRTAGELAGQLRRAIAFLPLEGRGGGSYRVGLWVRRRRVLLAAAGGVATAIAVAGLGWGALTALEEKARSDRADERLSRLEPTLDRLAEAESWDETELLVRAFAELPEHRGTRALSSLWRRHALRLGEGRQRGTLQAAANAWLAATDPESSRTSGATLVRELLRSGRYDGASQVARQLPPGPEVAALLQSTAVPRRVLDGPGLDPALRALGRATPLAIEAAGAALVDLDGDGRSEVLAFTAAEELVAWRLRPQGPAEVGRLAHPEGVVMQGRLVGRDANRLLAAGRGDDQRATLYTAPLDLSSPWSPFAVFGSGMPTDLTRVGSQVVVGTAWPERRLVSVELDSGEVGTPHPPTDALGSDLSGVQAADVDGDGQAELFVSQADWGSYLVSRLDRTERGFRASHRQVVGTTTGVAVARDDPGGVSRVYTVKVDRYRNTTVWGPDEPFGPPAGIYAFGPDLEPLGRLALPVGLDQSQGLAVSQRIWAWAPVAADLDGDGIDEVLVGYRGFRGTDSHDLVLVTDALGSRQTWVLAGLFLLAAGDTDADGDDELLVSDESNRVWLLGTGTGAIPTWRSQTSETREPPLPSRADGATRTVWQRASRLVGIGLHAEAAEALRAFASITEDASIAASCLERAAALLQEIGRDGEAARVYQALLEVAPDHQGGRDEPIRLLRRALLVDEAAALAGAPVARRSQALAPEELTAFDLEAPEAINPTGRGWDLRLYNDRGPVASAPLTVLGDRLGLEVSLAASVLEIGAGVAVEVLDANGRVVQGIDLSVEGGGGASELVVRCLFDHPRQLRSWALDGTPREYRVHSEWIDGRRGCRSAPDVKIHDVSASPEPGRYRLRIRSAGQADYRPPMLLAGTLQVELVGAVLERDGLAAARIGSGTAGGSADPGASHTNVPATTAWEASRNADSAALASLVPELTRTEQRRLLRDEVVAWPALQQVLGPGFTDLAAQALVEPFVQQPWRSDLFALAQRHELDGADLSSAQGRSLALARAEVLRLGGRTRRAVHIAEQVLLEGDPEASSRAHLLAARVHAGLRPTLAREHVQAFVAGASNPELARATVAADAQLRSFL